MWRGYGALCRNPPGRSIVPSTLISTASARTVWKPFEWAASPRIAWNATGRPITALVLRTEGVGPGERQREGLVEGHRGEFLRQALDAHRRDAGDLRGPFGRVARHAVAQQLERRRDARAVGQAVLALEGGIDRRIVVGVGARVAVDDVVRDGALAARVPDELVVRLAPVAARPGGRVEHERALVRAGLEVHELRRVGEALEECVVDAVGADQLVQQRHEQRAVGAGLDRNPLVGDRRVAGAHRIDRDEAPAAALELAERDLERVGVMVLGGADHHEQPGAVEVRPAELPERAADRVDHARGHVDRAEAAVRRVVRGAELAREHPGQRLHLVAAGEERELLRVGGADAREPLVQDLVGALPADRLELARAALGARLAQQRLRQARRRVLLHDPRRALGADHALVDRVLGVAVDVAHLAVAQVHADAAAARAHVAGGRLDLGLAARRGIGERIVHVLVGGQLQHADVSNVPVRPHASPAPPAPPTPAAPAPSRRARSAPPAPWHPAPGRRTRRHRCRRTTCRGCSRH